VVVERQPDWPPTKLADRLLTELQCDDRVPVDSGTCRRVPGSACGCDSGVQLGACGVDLVGVHSIQCAPLRRSPGPALS
jgi:hypothetical protein